MQTFLPFDDFVKSAEVLDYRRLGKQRVESLQILRTLRGETSGWSNHPAVKMWKGYEIALTDYMNICITEWVRRGFRNSMKIVPISTDYRLPEWFGLEEFHIAHQSNLLRKDGVFYGPKFPGVQPGLPYIWPV